MWCCLSLVFYQNDHIIISDLGLHISCPVSFGFSVAFPDLVLYTLLDSISLSDGSLYCVYGLTEYSVVSGTLQEVQHSSRMRLICLGSNEVCQPKLTYLLKTTTSNRFATRLEQVRTISTCWDSSNLLEPRRRPARSQIPLRYLVADRFEDGRRPAPSWNLAYHLAR